MLNRPAEHRAACAVMRFATPEFLNGNLKLFRNPFHLALGEHSRYREIPEGVEEIDLVFG